MFQSKAVLAYRHTRPSGFQDRIYVMYHSTDPKNVKSILTNGFNLSTGGTLGPGVYVSEDIKKTIPYGDVTLKLVVYVGKTVKVTSYENRSTWQAEANSAWIPAGCKSIGNGRSENCVGKSKQIRVIGVVRGWKELDSSTKELTQKKKKHKTVPLDAEEMRGLNDLKKEYNLP